MAVFTTSCPRNCYSTCTMHVEVQDARIRRIEPHAGNRATPEGACLKGLSYVERQHSNDRILHPMRRVGWQFERITWDEALGTIADRLQTYKGKFGPQSILFYAASGTKGLLNRVSMNFWKLFGGCTTTYGDLCWPAGLEATRLTLGENKHNAPWDIANAKLIILWGKNAAETNIHQMVFVNQAIDAGAKLVVIDPRRTETAKRADLLIQPRPGTDGVIALAVAHQLLKKNLIDTEFIERHVNGFDAYATMVRGGFNGDAYDPTSAASIADVPESQIHQLAEYLGTIEPATINCGYGMQRYANSGQTIRSILALLCITGNIGKPGAGWIFANLQSHIFDEARDPIAFYPPERPDGCVRMSISTALLGKHMLATKDPPLKMVWVERGNPLTQNPETKTVRQAFRALDFRVVVEQFMTDTAREADIILPSKTLFEQTDVINAYWHDYIQVKRKLLEPRGEVKPETVIYRELAHKLRFTDEQLEGLIPGASDEETTAFIDRILEPHGLSIAQLNSNPKLTPGHEEVAFADMEFPTPSGRIELVSAEAQQRWGVDELPTYKEPLESAVDDGASAKYPLHLMTPNTKNRIHSQFNNLATIRVMNPVPQVTISHTDATARGIAAGDRVRVFNDRGELVHHARIDHSLKPGCVVIENGWWATDGGCVNVLSQARETDMGYGAAFHENMVQVEMST